MPEHIPIAQPGDRLVVVRIEIHDQERQRLKLIGSGPTVYRRIDVDRGPVLLIDGFQTQLMWLPEAGGAFVSIWGQHEIVQFQALGPGTEIEMVSYQR